MGRSLRRFIVAIAVSLSLNAYGFMPESGIWSNPSESGRGFVIEIQDNLLFMGTFLYDTNGRTTWYQAAGPMSSSNSFSGALTPYSGGQCMGCPYVAPLAGTPIGTISLTFDSATTATVVWPGGTTRISRFAFGVNTSNPYMILGEWGLITGTKSFPVYFGERIQFSNIGTGSSGNYASGNISGESGINNIAVASMVSGSTTTWSILLDSSTSYWAYYSFTFTGLNTIQGTEWTYLKTSFPSGSGLPFVGFRMSGPTVLRTGLGPILTTFSVPANAITAASATSTPIDRDQLNLTRTAHEREGAGESLENIDEIRAQATALQRILEAH